MSLQVNRLHILHTAVAMLSKDRVNLDCIRTRDWHNNKDDWSDINFANANNASCMGGIACAIPLFNAEGLMYDGGSVTYNDSYDNDALAEFFGMSEVAAAVFFDFGFTTHDSNVNYAIEGEKEEWSDKRKALRRIRRLLKVNGSLTSSVNKRMKTFEQQA